MKRLIACCRLAVFVLACTTCACASAQANCTLLPKLESGNRYLFVISDLHFGLGRISGGGWNRKEDFRWSKALTLFLRTASACGLDAVDLVLAGDTLEMWQPPAYIACKGLGPEAGCTTMEALRIAKVVIGAHGSDLAALGSFADRGSNRLYVIPGNHDAALLLPSVWTAFRSALRSKSGRTRLVGSGIWASADGRVVVEHGHQIGVDVNKYKAWPDIIGARNAGHNYIERPWGELFVQRLFNEQEETYPIIDNLSPESAGARYRMADRGWVHSVADAARFLAFNLFETGLSQEQQFLGAADPGAEPMWDMAFARAMGSRLFAQALASGDPFRTELLEDTASGKALRSELDTLARDETRLSNAEITLLCDLMQARTQGQSKCLPAELGMLLQKAVVPKRVVMADHLRTRLKQPGLDDMRVFVYGHTHLLETKWPVQATDTREVHVLNAGAFQRVIVEDDFLALAASRKIDAQQALRTLSVEDLGACYSAVVVAMGPLVPAASTLQWHMTEGGVGSFVLPGDAVCKPAGTR